MSTGLLDAKVHERIIANFEQVCSTAGIQGRFLHETMKNYCSEAEVDWVRNFWKLKAQGVPGLALVGVKRPDTRCQAITAALLRHYIDARVIPLNSLLDEYQNGDRPPSPTVLVIPNLFLAVMGHGKNIPAWRIQVMYDLLLDRSIHSKPTVVYVENMDGVLSTYGAPFYDFLSQFVQVTE